MYDKLMSLITIFCQKLPHSGTKSETNIRWATKCSLSDTKLPTLVSKFELVEAS